MTDWPPVRAVATREIELVGTMVLAAPANIISVSGIDATFVMFEVVAWWKRDANAGTIGLRINNDSSANYNTTEMVCATDIGNPTVKSQAGITYLPLHYNDTLGNGTGSAYATLAKPLPSTRGVGSVTAGYVVTGGSPVQCSAAAWDWDNTTEMIARIDIISVTNNMDTGSRVTIGGGRAA